MWGPTRGGISRGGESRGDQMGSWLFWGRMAGFWGKYVHVCLFWGWLVINVVE